MSQQHLLDTVQFLRPWSHSGHSTVIPLPHWFFPVYVLSQQLPKIQPHKKYGIIERNAAVFTEKLNYLEPVVHPMFKQVFLYFPQKSEKSCSALWVHCCALECFSVHLAALMTVITEGGRENLSEGLRCLLEGCGNSEKGCFGSINGDWVHVKDWPIILAK